MLTAIKDYFKSGFGWADKISIGKIDNNADKAICFYTSNVAREAAHTIGGKALQSYHHKAVTILIRWGRSKQAAEDKAQAVFDFFDETQFELSGKHAFCLSVYEGPIDLGTDENGIFEYSIELDIYMKKES